jgi:hypothetical protein
MKKLFFLFAVMAFVIASCGPSAADLKAEAELEAQIQSIEQETVQIDQLTQELEKSADELEKLMRDI